MDVLTNALLGLGVALAGVEPITRQVLGIAVGFVLLIVGAAAVAQYAGATPWHEFEHGAFKPARVVTTVRRHRRPSLRRRAATWLLLLAGDVLANVADISKGLTA